MPHTRAMQLVRDGRLISLAVQASACVPSRARELTEALSASLDDIEDGPQCDVVVIRASGRDAEPEPAQLLEPDINRGLEKAMLRVSRLPCVTLAVIEGMCERMWLQLALACDQRIGTSRSSIRVCELKQGSLPSLSAFGLTHYLGLGRVRRLLFTGQELAAADCLSSGVFDVVCEPDGLDGAIKQLVKEFGPLCASASLALTKSLLRESLSVASDDLLGSYLAAQDRCLRLAPRTAKDGCERG